MRELRNQESQKNFEDVLKAVKNEAADEWLLFLDLLEISEIHRFDSDRKLEIKNYLEKLKRRDQKTESLINDGVRLIYETH